MRGGRGGLPLHDPARPGRAVKSGLRIPRHVATTAHLPAVYPLQAEAGIGERGVYLGPNLLAGGARFCWEPFEAYTDPRVAVTSANSLVVGMLGEGKSAFMKVFLSRALGCLASPDGSPRWATVFDPKGEYGPLAELLGMQHIELRPGGVQRLNPLDPGPVPSGARDELNAARIGLVGSLLATALGRELAQLEAAVLGWSIGFLGDWLVQPVLADLVRLWLNPPEELTSRALMTANGLRAELADLRLCLGRLGDGELAGMFDGRSTVSLDRWGRGAVVDLSSVFHDPHALPLVMLCVDSWTQQLYADPAQAGRRSYKVVDEAWALTEHERIARSLQVSSKLSRSLGCANFWMVHRLSDLGAQAPDGSAAMKIAQGLLSDAQTQFIFAQPEAEVGHARRLLGLTSTEAELLTRLPKGRCLVRVGRQAAVLDVFVGERDRPVCYTDGRVAV